LSELGERVADVTAVSNDNAVEDVVQQDVDAFNRELNLQK